MLRYDIPVPRVPPRIAALTLAGITMLLLLVLPTTMASHLPELPEPVIIAAGGVFPCTPIAHVPTEHRDAGQMVVPGGRHGTEGGTSKGFCN